jgi:hypothetical protein
VVPFRRAEVEVAPFRLEVGAEGHQSQAVAEVSHPTRRTERAQRPCSCVAVRVQAVLAVRLAAGTPHLQQVRQDRKGSPGARSQRTSGRSVGRSLLQERTAR